MYYLEEQNSSRTPYTPYNSEHAQPGHTDSFDTRYYYSGEEQRRYSHAPGSRENYNAAGLETRWDYYNAANYGRRPQQWQNSSPRANYYGERTPNDHFERDDYRYTSGNREWDLNRDNHQGRQERFHDRYNHPNRYANQQNRPTQIHDVFEWVGEGVNRLWDGITGHRHPQHRPEYYPHHTQQPYEQRPAHPEELDRIGGRPDQTGFNQESDAHRAGRHFNRGWDL